MSETIEPEIPVITPERQRVLEQRRENLARARAAKKNKPRVAEKRTAKDAAQIGVAAHPGQAEPARQSRESNPEILTRTRRENRDSGWADIPAHCKKPDWDYEWKVIKVLNEKVDTGDMLDVRNAGWRAEKAANWPDLVEPGTPMDAPIERRGQRLYGRPLRLTNEARAEDLQVAYQQQRDKTNQAASGRSAIRGEEGIPTGRAVRTVPISVEIEGLAG